MKFVKQNELLEYYLKNENKYAILLSIDTDEISNLNENYEKFKEYLGEEIFDHIFFDEPIIIFENEKDMEKVYWEKFSDGNPQADTQDNPRPGFPRIYALTLGPNGSLDENTWSKILEFYISRQLLKVIGIMKNVN